MNHRPHDIAVLAKNRATGAQPDLRAAAGSPDRGPIDHGLDLAVIGNGRTAALVDPNAAHRVVVLSALRRRSDFLPLLSGDEEKGFSDVVLEDMAALPVAICAQHRAWYPPS